MSRNTEVVAQHDAPPITRTLAQFVTHHPSQGWGKSVDHEAHRTFLNWMGCAVGAAQHAAPSAALGAAQALQSAPQASLAGRSERVDMASAALINGISSHTFDFDDTHLKTIIHPAGPVASAALALAEHHGHSGRELIDALILGVDVACRLGNMVYPEHYDRGWHITGSTGMFGAAAACARLLRLNEQQCAMALGIAASQPIGLREQFGTMSKPFHPGAAASAGLKAALLAQHGFTASARAIEAARGWAQVVSTKFDWREATDDLGQRFEISFNSYKPFACGVVIHPCIDACVQLRAQGVSAADIVRLELKVHPLVLELTGKKEPADGLQAKFSVYHGCAVGLIYGRAGEHEFSDAVAAETEVVQLRRKVQALVSPGISEAATELLAVLNDGRSINISIKHAVGSLEKPLSDAELQAKFDGLAEPILGQQRAAQLRATCWQLGSAATVKGVTDLMRLEAR